jgi:CheY-like chemotaxis protein
MEALLCADDRSLTDVLICQLETLARLQRRADGLNDELARLHQQIARTMRQAIPLPHAPTDLLGHQTILVADDQVIVRAITQTILESFGYQVLVTDTDLHACPVDLVLFDVPVWHESLPDRIRMLKAQHARLIVSTPLPAGPALASLRQAGADAFVSKPLEPIALARCIREVLAER